MTYCMYASLKQRYIQDIFPNSPVAELFVTFCDKRLRFVAFQVLLLTVHDYFRQVCKRRPLTV